MKYQKIIIVIVILSIFYACGSNNGTNSDGNANDSLSRNELSEQQTNKLQSLFDTIKQENIHIVKYKGTLGDNKITLEFLQSTKQENRSIYLYDNINSPILLQNETKGHLVLQEMFPDKTKKGEYKNGGKLIFKNHRKCGLKLEGEYINPKGDKSYPVKLEAVNLISHTQTEPFEELQGHSTSEHYFTVQSTWITGAFENKMRSVKQINVYEKKTNKKVQSLAVPFGDYLSFACVEPTNTKPNGIQIGCCPDGIVNPNGFEDYIAFFPKNGSYQKDTLVCGRKEYKRGDMYRKYNKNGDILENSSYSEQDFYENIIFVTTQQEYQENISEDIPNNVMQISRTHKNYVEEITLTPVDYDLKSDEKPIYMKTVKKDKKTDEILSCSVETNYPKDIYKVSSDGKTLLKWLDVGIILDLNGQNDLRKVEKFDKLTFASEGEDEEDIYKLAFELRGYQLFSISLNKNFKTIPPEIKMYENLAERTKLAPKCLQ